ncbi:MAG TPA: DNA internalization-related competence protein ComEC/Rec2 [Pseudobacteroides sp.]|nr:DNA internalization-related competence protein ComEC/Rec2 [Pseudobacteroides sp.]
MYIIISIFAAYAGGIISYELNLFGYYLTAISAVLVYNSIINKKYVYNAVIIAFVILSYLNCHYNSSSVLSQYINDSVTIEAKIKRQSKSDSISYHASVTAINNTPLFDEENIILYTDSYKNFRENSLIKVRGQVAGNHFTKNKMLFSYENYLRAKKIKAAIFAQGDAVVIKENYSFINHISGKFRAYTEKTFYGTLNKKNADIILSIILGDVNYLEEELYDKIKVMGMAHIFAVSGTHIVFMYVFLLNVFKFVFNRRLSWILSWCIIWFYGLLIGFPLSVMRALIMFTLLFGSEVLYRKYNSLNSIGLAALVLTVYNPFWIIDAGFLLSFSAALSFIIYNNYIKTKATLLKDLNMYFFLQIFTLPVVVYYFNFIPLMGFIYNLLLLPVFTVIMIYGFMLLILNPLLHIIFKIPFEIFDYILHSLRYIIDIADKSAFNGIIFSTMSMCHTLFFYLALFFMIYSHKSKIHCKQYGLAAIVSFYTLTYIIIPMGDESLYLNVADVGQGLFTTIRYKGLNMVYDCGSTSSKNMGEHIVLPYLTKRGIRELDAVFISHWDDDHYSGLEYILNNHIKVGPLYSSRNNETFHAEVLYAGYKMKYDDNLSMEILWPYKNINLNDTNNSSLVLSLNYKNRSILLPGDIEEEAEYAIYNDLNTYDVVLVPHHGSKTSSSVQFVDATAPKIAIFSYGKNSYGIPDQEVVSRYKNSGSKILSTFDHGEINIVLKDDKIYYNTYMDERSDNYYELCLTGIISKICLFFFLLLWMLKGDGHELYFNQKYGG